MIFLGIFKDFFLNFYKFNSIYFELNSFKLFILSRADMADDLARSKKRRTWRHMRPSHVPHV